jgi:hypothetical protein
MSLQRLVLAVALTIVVSSMPLAADERQPVESAAAHAQQYAITCARCMISG